MISEHRIPNPILNALNETGVEWHLDPGKKHIKIYVGPVMAGILPLRLSKKAFSHDRNVKATIAQIRRSGLKAREIAADS